MKNVYVHILICYLLLTVYYDYKTTLIFEIENEYETLKIEIYENE